MDQRLHSLAAFGWRVSPGGATVLQALSPGTEHRLRGGRAAGDVDKEAQRFVSLAVQEALVL